MTVKSCLKSMRLRTLPLSLAGIVVGIALASDAASLEVPVVVLLVATTALLQILSNLSNELGDTLHGTDTAERQGIRYSIQDGEMTVRQMTVLIAVVAALCCLSGLAMVYCSFKSVFELRPLCLLALGAAAIAAAMRYTLGRNPYGYRGLGDVAVFIFFGLVSVLGAAYVCSHIVRASWILPAAAIGLWSIGVLNVNNIRDMRTDAATRTTVALKLGLKRARIYQTCLVAGGWMLMLAYSAAVEPVWICFVTIPLYALHLRGVWTRTEKALDPMLPMLVMTTFVTAVLFAVPVCSAAEAVSRVAGPQEPVICSSRAAGSPMTDASAWDRASAVEFSDSSVNDNLTRVKSLWDKDSLYFRFEVEDTRLWSTTKEKDSGHVYLDDMVEFLIDPRFDRGEMWIEDDIIYHINLLGVKKDDRGTPAGDSDCTWDGSARYVISMDGTLNDNSDTDRGYVMLVAVPWEEIGVVPSKGVRMGVNVGNDDKEDDEEQRRLLFWSPCRVARCPADFAVLILK